MKMPAGFHSSRPLEGWMPSLRNLACVAVFAIGAMAMAAAQQPASPAAAQPAAAQAVKTAAVPAVISKPAAPQTPQQKQLADDTAKLYALANELKADLDKSGKDTLSLSVIRKAQEVERLAHKVRDEMKANLH